MSSGNCSGCGRLLPESEDFDFSSVLTRLMARYGVTDYEIERITGVDHTHISRLRRGLKSPTRDMIATIVFALASHGLTINEADELYETSGFASPHRRRYRDDPVANDQT